MQIGQNIKRLRKERNLTQEELAERLNISPQAVSKWENGITSPDISQLLSLVSVFGVSADALLGLDNRDEDAEVERIIREASDKDSRTVINTDEEAVASQREYHETLHNALTQYPNNIKLLNACLEIGTSRVLTGEGGEPSLVAECERMARLIFEYAKNAAMITETHSALTWMYLGLKDFVKAREHANALPIMPQTSGKMLANIHFDAGEYEKQMVQCERNIRFAYGSLLDELTMLAASYRKQEKYEDAIEVSKSLIGVSEALFGEERDPFLFGSTASRPLAVSYLRLGDVETTIDYLEKMVDETVTHLCKFGTVIKSNRAIGRDLDVDLSDKTHGNLRALVENYLGGVRDEAALRDHPRFVALLERVATLS